jgi:uncharacterized membrane protein
MLPLLVLVIAFAIFLLAGRLGVARLASWVTCLRWAVALMFLLTASAHFGSQRDDLVRMVPAVFPAPELLVTLTGFAEIAGAIGLVLPRFAPYAATGLALLLVAMFPANIKAALEELTIGGRAVLGVVPRGILQVVFLAAVLLAGFGPRLQERRIARRAS